MASEIYDRRTPVTPSTPAATERRPIQAPDIEHTGFREPGRSPTVSPAASRASVRDARASSIRPADCAVVASERTLFHESCGQSRHVVVAAMSHDSTPTPSSAT